MGPRDADDDGMVTVEAALVLPTAVVVLAMALWTFSAAAVQLRCSDAAAVAGRAAAAGAAPGEVTRVARLDAPSATTVAVTTNGSWLTVRVAGAVQPPGVLARLLPALSVGDSVTVWRAAGTGAAASRTPFP